MFKVTELRQPVEHVELQIHWVMSPYLAQRQGVGAYS